MYLRRYFGPKLAEKETPDLLGGGDPGRGGCYEGGRRKLVRLKSLVHRVRREHANLAQLFIGEEGLNLIAGALGMAQAGLV